MMLVLYFAWFHDQLGTKDVAKIGAQKTNAQMME
jgi:molybdopterin converting factor small subunit